MSAVNGKPVLMEKEIEEYINNWYESDDNIESSSDKSDPGVDFDTGNAPIFLDTYMDIFGHYSHENDDQKVMDTEGIVVMSDTDNNIYCNKENVGKVRINGPVLFKENLKTCSEKKNLILNNDILQFKGDTTFPMSIQNLGTPY